MQRVRSSNKRPATLLWVFLFFLSIYIFTAGGHYYSSDGLTVYLVARSIVTTGSVFIQEIDALPQLAIESGINNSNVPVVLPAQSIMMMPLYFLGNIFTFFNQSQFSNYLLQLTTSFLNSFITAFLILFFYIFLRKMDYSKKTAIISSLILGLTTIVWPYSKFDFSEPMMTLFLFGGFYWLFAFGKDKKLYQIFLAGTFIGIAQLTKFSALIAVGPLLLYYLLVLYADWKERRDLKKVIANLAVFGGSILFFFSGIFIYNIIRFGSLLSTGYSFSPQSTGSGIAEFTYPMILGIFGLTFSSGKGFFLYSPTALLFFLGIRPFLKKNMVPSFIIILMTLVTLAFFSRFIYWHGDVALGPRYLVYLTPFIMLPVAEAVERFYIKRYLYKSFFSGLVVTGFIVQLITISVFYNTYLNRLIDENPGKIGGVNEITKNVELEAVWYEPKYAPIIGELRSLPGRVSNWKRMIQKNEETLVSEDYSKIFFWFLKDVPDYWWVYFSISKAPKVYLLSLMLPFSVFMYSGYRLLGDVKEK